MYIRSEIEYDRVCCVGQREEGVSSLYRLDGALNWAQFAARSAEIGSAGHVCPASEILAQPGRLTGDHIKHPPNILVSICNSLWYNAPVQTETH